MSRAWEAPMIETAPRPVLRTARLTLRPLRLADAPQLARLANDWDVVKMTGAMPYPYTLANAQGLVARAEVADPATEAFFAIELEGEGPVGVLSFHPKDAYGPEIGYWIGQPFWGRGLATEMLPPALVWARDTWGKRSIAACHAFDNDASGRVLIKAGFLYTGLAEPRRCVARGEDVLSRWMVWLA
jgi:RimJ/RimL family protein N-acetyltransferase